MFTMNALKSTLPIRARAGHNPYATGRAKATANEEQRHKRRKNTPMGMATPKTLISAKPLRALLAAGLIVSVSACSWNDKRSETMGGVLGGVFGAVLGSKAGKGTGRNVGVAVGATLGTMLGQDIAKGLSDVDQVFHKRTTDDALKYGKPGEQVSWSNPDSGNSGAVTPGETYQNDAGQDCRDFETQVQVDGEDRTAKGTACRMEDGTWQVVEEPA